MTRKRGKTGSRHSIRNGDDTFVRVTACPDDECLGVPLFDRGNCFDRRTFVRSLRECVFPVGMRVSLRYGTSRQLWIIFTLSDGSICLRQCDVDGYLVGGGKTLVPIGSELREHGL